jgi:hypothetical protein
MLPSASQTPAHWCLSDGVEWVPNTPKTPKQGGFPEDARAVLGGAALAPELPLYWQHTGRGPGAY